MPGDWQTFVDEGNLLSHNSIQAGDKIEAAGVGSVFATCRPADSPLVVGSVSSTPSDMIGGNRCFIAVLLLINT